MATLAVGAERRTFGLGRHLALAAFWFGGSFHWGPILPILLPYQVHHLVPHQRQGAALGVIFGLGSFFAMVVPPLVGAWSDRLSSRFGRRRPVMVAATGINVVGLLLMFLAPSYGLLVLAYLVLQIANNAAGAAFAALVPDIVPGHEFGRQSGILGAMVQLGIVAGLGTYLLLARAGLPLATYLVIAVVLVVTLFPTLLAGRGERRAPIASRPSPTLRAAAAEFLRPLFAGDFAWVIWTRMMITAGVWCVLPFVQFFFSDVGRIAHADQFTSLWELVLLLAAIPFGLLGSWLSDRRGRKLFVYLSGSWQSLALILFIVLFPTQTALILAIAILYGAGYGLYYAVDWALACDTVPDRRAAAKDMGLFHVAFTLPQVVLPAILGFVLDAVNHTSPNGGYRVVFSFAVVFFLLGTVLVSRIKSVR